jgi:heme oxygenase
MADGDDVLVRLRAGTAAEHEAVETTLDLLDPGLTRARLIEMLTRMHGFWCAAEDSLDAWADAAPADAAELHWPRRRRAHLFAADLEGLGAPAARPGRPRLPAVPATGDALGRLYVLEGSTLGGIFIDRHLAALPQRAGASFRAFSPYGAETGAMWHAYRTATRARVDAGVDADLVVATARQTFTALAAWCGAPVRGGAGNSRPQRSSSSPADVSA